MGLDSYLWKKTLVNNWSDKKFVKYDVNVTSEGKPVEHIQSDRVHSITEEIGYWRKANHIHNWFVQNIQNGVDNCKPHYVEKEDLVDLLGICRKVVENPSLGESLLPCSRGFFFGSDEYDEWYIKQLKYTIELIEKILSLKDEGVYYEYESSW